MTMDKHADDAPGHPGAVAHHATDDHGEDHGHDDHAHPDETLGPLDPMAWGAGLLGVLIGVVVAVCFYASTVPL